MTKGTILKKEQKDAVQWHTYTLHFWNTWQHRWASKRQVIVHCQIVVL